MRLVIAALFIVITTVGGAAAVLAPSAHTPAPVFHIPQPGAPVAQTTPTPTIPPSADSGGTGVTFTITTRP
jgi:hypothetical protein